MPSNTPETQALLPVTPDIDEAKVGRRMLVMVPRPSALVITDCAKQAACELIGNDTYGKPVWTVDTISPENRVVQAFARFERDILARISHSLPGDTRIAVENIVTTMESNSFLIVREFAAHLRTALASISTPTAEPMAELQRLGQEYDTVPSLPRDIAAHVETLNWLSSQYLPGGPRDVKGAIRAAVNALTPKVLCEHGHTDPMQLCNDCEASSAALTTPPTPDRAVSQDFQTGVGDWMLACFGSEIADDRLERADRFTEEALELAQTIPGFTADRAHALVDYVFSRPVGERGQEVGGTMVTLAALCNTFGININDEAERELARVWTKVDAIRAKQAAKPTGSALPMATPTPDRIGKDAVREALPKRCDGIEQPAFEEWAKAQGFDMTVHPLHYLFLDARTDAARQAWCAGIKHASDRIAALSATPAQEGVGCPKCGSTTGNDWMQCEGSCPMPQSPHFATPAQTDPIARIASDLAAGLTESQRND